MKMNVKGNDNFRTPQGLYEQLDRIFNFTLDAACTREDCKAPRGLYHDEGVDALEISWGGGNGFSAIRPSAAKPNLLQRLFRRLCKEIVRSLSWCFRQIAKTAKRFNNTSKSNSFSRRFPDVLLLSIRKQSSHSKGITPEQLLSILRRI